MAYVLSRNQLKDIVQLAELREDITKKDDVYHNGIWYLCNTYLSYEAGITDQYQKDTKELFINRPTEEKSWTKRIGKIKNE